MARPGSGSATQHTEPSRDTCVPQGSHNRKLTEESLIYTLEAHESASLKKGKKADQGFLVIVVLNYKERLCSEDIWLAWCTFCLVWSFSFLVSSDAPGPA